MREFSFDDMIRNNVSLLSPAEPGQTWAAEAPLFENRFLVEDINPKIAVATVLEELIKHDQYIEPHYSDVCEEEFMADPDCEANPDTFSFDEVRTFVSKVGDSMRQFDAELNPRSQAELREIASLYSDQYRPGEPGYCPANKAKWTEVADYPLDNLLCEELPSKQEWVGWLNDEIDMFVSDGMDEVAQMYRDMINGDIDNPVIVLERHGKAFIWDGNHRVGASFAGNKTTIKAIVGQPASSFWQ